MAELASAIVCGCLPVLPLLFRQYVPRIRNLTATLRRIGQSTSNDKNQRPIYVELDEHSKSTEGVGTTEKGGKQGHRSDMKITAHRDMYEMDSEI